MTLEDRRSAGLIANLRVEALAQRMTRPAVNCPVWTVQCLVRE